jgi:hypothetical protein
MSFGLWIGPVVVSCLVVILGATAWLERLVAQGSALPVHLATISQNERAVAPVPDVGGLAADVVGHSHGNKEGSQSCTSEWELS